MQAYLEIAKNKTIYVAPLDNFSMRYKEHEAVYGVIEKAIKSYLRNNGFKVLPTFEFTDAWKACEAQLGGLYDTQTGDPDLEQHGKCLENTILKLAKSREFSCVMLPEVVYKPIEMKEPYLTGSWDVVRRKMKFEGGRSSPRWMSAIGMTLNTTILTRDGALAYESSGGLDFAQKSISKGSKLILSSKEPEDFDPENLHEGVEVALTPFVNQ